MKTILKIFLVIFLLDFRIESMPLPPGKIPVILDTDANNELDDQHALAYAFFNSQVFDIKGVTVNNTKSGAGMDRHYEEAMRVAKLCRVYPQIKVYKGATGNYDQIRPQLNKPDFDGQAAVNFIIGEAKKASNQPLVILAVGKLTNVALALEKAPEIKSKVRVVWLASNYPDPGEYNLENDTTSVNPVIQSGVPFEMVLVRYGQSDGTAAVTATQAEINQKMPGKGPQAEAPVTGRHGGSFNTFGDYAVNLFEHIHLEGNPPARSLFDMAAVAIVKNPDWAKKVPIPAPRLVGNSWKEQPANPQKIWIWQNFKKDQIMADFYQVMDIYHVPSRKH